MFDTVDQRIFHNLIHSLPLCFDSNLSWCAVSSHSQTSWRSPCVSISAMRLCISISEHWHSQLAWWQPHTISTPIQSAVCNSPIKTKHPHIQYVILSHIPGSLCYRKVSAFSSEYTKAACAYIPKTVDDWLKEKKIVPQSPIGIGYLYIFINLPWNSSADFIAPFTSTPFIWYCHPWPIRMLCSIYRTSFKIMHT